MTKVSTSKYLLITGAILFSLSTVTFANDVVVRDAIVIPTIEDAQIFSELTDDIPAVLNYFTDSSEQKIVDFYQKTYGDASFQDKKLEGLTLVYKQSQKTIRIVISQQKNKRQVDIIVK
jgi:hypothetical protein